jgi:cytoplasmic iron level regulating protein YaaA (DUF328/UPF0246 family)
MKAIDAYIGPMYQVIQKAKREGRWIPQMLVGIISAKYGFLRDEDLIEDYELRMSPPLAKELNPSIIEGIASWHEEAVFEEIYVLMGKDYLQTVKGLQDRVKTKIKIENMGGLGLGQAKLKRFIDSHAPKQDSLLDYVK